MEIKWEAIIQAVIASGVFSTIFTLIFKKYIEGKIKLLFDKKLKEYEAKLRLSTELGIEIGKERIKEYKEVSSVVNSARKLCQEMEKDINSGNYNNEEFELEIRRLQGLIYDYSTTLRIDNIYEKIHGYKVKLMSICKNINNYNSLRKDGNNERASGVKGIITESTLEIEKECKSISNQLKTLIEESIGNVKE